jgi:hypothetical protein
MEQACAKGSPNDAVILALSDVVRFQRSSKLPACAVCDGAVSDGALASKESLLASVAADAQARKQAQAEAQRAADMEASMLAKLQAGIAAFQAAQAAWEAYQPVQTPTGGADAVNAAAMALRTANDAQAALNRTAGAWKSVRSLKQEEREAKKAIAALEELIEGCKAAVEGILKSATDTFIARVQSFLPATDVFALELNDGDREVCRFGFVRDGNLHTALSGAEWARLTLALACAASGEATDTLRVFVPEDRAFDPNTLRDVLVALANAPGQVIFATTTKPAGRLPKGWTLIETGLTD